MWAQGTGFASIGACIYTVPYVCFQNQCVYYCRELVAWDFLIYILASSLLIKWEKKISFALRMFWERTHFITSSLSHLIFVATYFTDKGNEAYVVQPARNSPRMHS